MKSIQGTQRRFSGKRPVFFPARFALVLLGLLFFAAGLAGGEQDQSHSNHPLSPARSDTIRVPPPGSCPYVLLPGNDHGTKALHLLGWAVGDFDGDSWDELITAFVHKNVPGSTGLLYWDYPNGWAEVTRQLNLTHCLGIARRFSGDLDLDGSVDLAVSFKDGSNAWGAVYSGRGKRIFQTPVITGPDTQPTGEWDGCVCPLAVADLDQDGKPELLVYVNAAYDLSPRGLIAYDMTDGRELWFFHCGSVFEQIIPLQDPETGETVLLISTCAVANGSKEGGFSDNYAYLILLGPDGEVRQQTSMGGKAAKLGIAVADFDADGRQDVVAAVSSNFQLPWATYRLCLLDPFTFEVKREVDPGTFLGSPLIGDLDSDGRPEIVSSWQNMIFIFESDLTLVREIPCGAPVHSLLISDLTGDGQPELAFAHGRVGEVLVITPTGRILAGERIPNQCLDNLVVVRWGPRSHLLYGFSDFRAIGMTMEPCRDWLARLGASSASRGWHPALLGIALGLATGVGATLVLTRRRGKAQTGGAMLAPGEGRRIPEGAKGGTGEPVSSPETSAQMRATLTQLTTFGHGEPGQLLGRAATLLQAANLDLVGDPEWRRQAAECCNALRRTIPPLLRTSVSSRAILAEHGFPPEKILGRFHRISDETEVLLRKLGRDEVPDPDAVVRIGQSIFHFDELLRNLRRRLRDAFRCDVIHAVASLLDMKHHLLLDIKVQQRQLTAKGWGSFTAKIDSQRLQFEVLDDLIVNATRAMQDAAVRNIAISVEQVGQMIRIRLSDTGCGMDLACRESLFHRGISTRPGGRGLGLFQARQTLREFGGDIYVERSSPGKGTVMVVAIPAATPPTEPAPSPPAVWEQREKSPPVPTGRREEEPALTTTRTTSEAQGSGAGDAP